MLLLPMLCSSLTVRLRMRPALRNVCANSGKTAPANYANIVWTSGGLFVFVSFVWCSSGPFRRAIFGRAHFGPFLSMLLLHPPFVGMPSCRIQHVLLCALSSAAMLLSLSGTSHSIASHRNIVAQHRRQHRRRRRRRRVCPAARSFARNCRMQFNFTSVFYDPC